MPGNPQTSPFWGTFLDTHGSNSEEEAAFLGYLTTHQIDPGGEPSLVAEAYTAFHAWMTDSYTHDATASEAANVAATSQGVAEARAAELALYAVPRSSHGDVRLQKPNTAATRPPESRVAPPPPPPETPPAAAAPPPPQASARSRSSSEGSA